MGLVEGMRSTHPRAGNQKTVEGLRIDAEMQQMGSAKCRRVSAQYYESSSVGMCLPRKVLYKYRAFIEIGGTFSQRKHDRVLPTSLKRAMGCAREAPRVKRAPVLTRPLQHLQVALSAAHEHVNSFHGHPF